MTAEGFEKLKAYIIDELISEDHQVDDDTSLFSTRIVNSRNLMSLVSFLEEEFDIKISPMDLTLDNFDTINNMTVYVKSRME